MGRRVINLKFSIEEVNQLLSLLGNLPFNATNNFIRMIVEQAQPQAEAIEAANKQDAE